MVTSTETAPERVMHPTREGFTASAYYVLGHVLGLAGLLAMIGFVYWYGLHPTSVVGWVGLAFVAGVWALGRLRRWASLSAWAEVPGAYRVYSVAAGDRFDTGRRPVFWDYFFGLARFVLGVAGGTWLASRGDIEPDVRAILLAVMGAFLASMSLWRNVWDVLDGASSWRVQRYGELLLDAAPLGMGVAWVVAGLQVDNARPVFGLAVSIALLTFAFLTVFRMMRSTFRSMKAAPPEEAMQKLYAVMAQAKAEREATPEPHASLWKRLLGKGDSTAR